MAKGIEIGRGTPIYGVTDRPYSSLTDEDLAARRARACLSGDDMRLIIALNTETQLRELLGKGAKIMPTPTVRGRGRRR